MLRSIHLNRQNLLHKGPWIMTIWPVRNILLWTAAIAHLHFICLQSTSAHLDPEPFNLLRMTEIHISQKIHHISAVTLRICGVANLKTSLASSKENIILFVTSLLCIVITPSLWIWIIVIVERHKLCVFKDVGYDVRYDVEGIEEIWIVWWMEDIWNAYC